MKTLKPTLLCIVCFLALLARAAAQAADPAPQEPATRPAAAAVDAQPATPSAAQAAPAQTDAPAAPENGTDAPGRTRPAPARATANGSQEIRINFRNAPLESVLSYLSEAAGFIIQTPSGTDLKGKVTVWSNQPVTKQEALERLFSALDQNGYTAVTNGRTLLIYNKEDAKKQNIPVRTSNKPEDIPNSDQMVTQIIPVRFIDAVQVSRDLQPLLPDKATMTANQGGNAILITDAQSNIKRMVEIIRALDTAISSVSSVRVFPLKYADSKALAAVLKDLFAPQDTAARGGNTGQGQGRFFNMMRGGGAGGFGNRGGGGGGAGDSSASGGRAPSPRVVAVAEEYSNSIVVSAPEDQMPLVADVIEQVDTNVEDVTEVKVFRLHYADAQETSDLLNNLFSDTGSGSGSGFRGGFTFGGRGFGGFNRGNNAAASQSARIQKQTRVMAQPDLRTGSVVVSAARDLMKEIAKMIDELDADPAKKQQVFIYPVQNTDPQQVLSVLQSLFPAPNNGTYNSRTMGGNQQNSVGNQLNNRAQQLQNQGYGVRGNNGGFGGLGSGGLGSGLGSGSR